MLTLQTRDADVVKYLYLDFLAGNAPYRASRVVRCNAANDIHLVGF